MTLRYRISWYGCMATQVCHPKTTVNISDELSREAQEVARREDTTLRELIETGLRTVVGQRSSDIQFVLSDASIGGQSMQPSFIGATWKQIRDAVSE